MPWGATWPRCGNALPSRARSFWRVFRIGAIARRRAISSPGRAFHGACEATRNPIHATWKPGATLSPPAVRSLLGQSSRLQPPQLATSEWHLQQANASFPIRFAVEVGMDLPRPARVGHSRQKVPIETGCVDQSLKVDIDDAALVDSIDGYCAPGNGNHFLTHPQKASNSHKGVGNVPGMDVQHEFLDLPQKLAGR